MGQAASVEGEDRGCFGSGPFPIPACLQGEGGRRCSQGIWECQWVRCQLTDRPLWWADRERGGELPEIVQVSLRAGCKLVINLTKLILYGCTRQHQCSHQCSVERVVEWCQGIFRTKYTANKKIGIAGDPASARGCTVDLTKVRWVKRTHLWCLFCEIASIGRSHRCIHFTGWMDNVSARGSNSCARGFVPE